MGIIEIEGMEFYAYHGHFEEEQIVGNRFIVYLRIEGNTSNAATTDNLNNAINYQTAYNIVKKQMKLKSHLLENIAGRILDAIYQEIEGIKKVTVKISKLNPPMGGKIDKVSVTMSK